VLQLWREDMELCPLVLDRLRAAASISRSPGAKQEASSLKEGRKRTSTGMFHRMRLRAEATAATGEDDDGGGFSLLRASTMPAQASSDLLSRVSTRAQVKAGELEPDELDAAELRLDQARRLLDDHTSSRVALLRGVELFSDVSRDADLRQITGAVVPITVAADEELLTEGELGEHCMYIVESGSLVATRAGQQGEVGRYEVGAWFGERTLMLETLDPENKSSLRAATVTGVTASSTVLQLWRQDLAKCTPVFARLAAAAAVLQQPLSSSSSSS